MNRLSRLALNEEGFGFDPATGDSYVLNPTASLIFRQLQAGWSSKTAAETLSGTFMVDESQAERDVLDFVEGLRALGLR